jgi:hypothetical protein
MEEVDRAKIAKARAVRLLKDAGRTQADTRATLGMMTLCPLCGHPAVLKDWRPSLDWVCVKGCPCDGFFVVGRILDTRLPSLPPVDREEVLIRVRQFRAMGHEAWCGTTDGTVDGPLVVRTQRPDRPA